MGHHVDGLKFAGGSFSLFPEPRLRELTDLAHEHGVYVSTVRLNFSALSPERSHDTQTD
jgi:phosphosulfolactate synthase (CoM biosynthesis protein A)